MADKGIRVEASRKFRELLPTRENTRIGNRNFRASVNTHLMEMFGIKLHSAATAYNNAFIDARKEAAGDASKNIPPNTELAKLLEGLGRPEDKKGGRKPKNKPAATTTTAPETGAATGSEVLQSNILGSGGDEGDGDDTPPPAAKVKVIQKNGKAGPWEFDTEEQAAQFIQDNSGQFKPKMFIEGKE